jgi:hypothetical protein
VENLNPPVRCGARQNLCQTTKTESWLTLIPLCRRSQSASRRDDQCVTPAACKDLGGRVTVAARISHATSSVSTRRGPPGRGASSSPGRSVTSGAYWPSAGGQRLVMMVVTGRLNRRSA